MSWMRISVPKSPPLQYLCFVLALTAFLPITPSRDLRGALIVDGRLRRYRLHVPPQRAPHEVLPLVIVLHGHGGTASRIMRLSRMNQMADAGGFLVAYPEGTSWLDIPWRSWNAGHCCGYAMRRGVDDVAFIRQLIEDVRAHHAIDAHRVYVTGVSNGGMMAYRLGCELSDRLAAIAPVAGSLGVACHPSSPVSVMIVHGTDDHSVPHEGGISSATHDQRRDPSVAFTASLWAAQNHCAAAPETDEHGALLRQTYAGGLDGTEVVVYTIRGGGHAWPRRDLSTTELMWDFFSRHPKPE